MTEKLKQIIQEEVMKLPKEMRDAINAFDWVKATEEIGGRLLLTENEINKFQLETLLVLVNLEYPHLYENNIENNVGVGKEKASQIARETYQKIFRPMDAIFVENIKKNLKNKNPNWRQSIDFILSGGNYSAFLEIPPLLDKEGSVRQLAGGAGGGNFRDPLSNLPLSRGRNFQSPPRFSGPPPQKRGEENKSKMTDLKDKFTI